MAPKILPKDSDFTKIETVLVLIVVKTNEQRVK